MQNCLDIEILCNRVWSFLEAIATHNDTQVVFNSQLVYLPHADHFCTVTGFLGIVARNY